MAAAIAYSTPNRLRNRSLNAFIASARYPPDVDAKGLRHRYRLKLRGELQARKRRTSSYGFRTVSAFGRRFREVYDMTPAQAREQALRGMPDPEFAAPAAFRSVLRARSTS
jgi:hypothetical protein